MIPALLLVALSLALAYLWPVEGILGIRFWSLTPLRYLPPAVVIAFVILAIVAMVRTTRRSEAGRAAGENEVERGWRTRLRKLDGRKVTRVAAITTAIGLVTTLTVRYGLLGDNWLRVSEILAGSGSRNERGAIAAYSALAGSFGDGTLEGAAAVVRGVGQICGVVWAVLWVAITARTGCRLSERRTLITLALFSGVFLLFCGYLEIYAPVLVMLLILALTALIAADRPRLVLLPPLLALGASAFHLVALLWLPMALVPLLARAIGTHRPRVLSTTALAVASGIGLALVLSRDHSLFLRLTPEAGRPYSLLSLSHVSDYVNAQWVGSVTGVLLGWWGTITAFRRTHLSVRLWLAIWSWLLPGIGLFLFNPVLGGADWDVLALAAPFGLLVAATVVAATAVATTVTPTTAPAAADGTAAATPAVSKAGLRPRGRGAPRMVAEPQTFLRSRIFPVALALNILVTPAWLVLHRSSASVEWVADLIRSDRADYYQSHPPDLHLAFLYGSNGLGEARRLAFDSGRAAHPNDPRFPLGLARIAVEEQDWEQAETMAMESYGIVRGYLPALDVLYDVFRATGQVEDQKGVGELLLEAARTDPAEVSKYLSAARIAEIERDLADGS